MRFKFEKDIKEFLQNFYPDPYCCLITGSHIDGKENQYSDIDVLIFLRNRKKVFNETLYYNGLKIQSIIIPLNTIDEVLWLDYDSYKGAFVDMISKSYILVDNNNFGKKIKHHTQKLNDLGPPKVSDSELYFIRVKLTSLLHDLKGSSDERELIVTMSNLIDGLTKFILCANNYWCGDGKQRNRFLNQYFLNFSEQLWSANEVFFLRQDKSKLISLVEKTLESHGGIIESYSKNDFLRMVPKDYLVIEISLEKLKSSGSNIEAFDNKFNSFLQKIYHPSLAYYSFIAKPVGKNQIESNIYMVIHTDNNHLNTYLVERLRDLCLKDSFLNSFKFPYQFDPVFKFSNTENYNKFLPFFSLLERKSKIQMIQDSYAQMEMGIAVFRVFRSKFFNKESGYLDFLHYLFRSWVAYGINDENIRNSKSLVERINQKKASYDELYNSDITFLRQQLFGNEQPVVKELANTLTFLDEDYYIPEYKDFYLLHSQPIKWVLYKEFLTRSLNICFLDDRIIAYFPFILLKLEKNE